MGQLYLYLLSTHNKDTLGFLLPARRQTHVQVLLRQVILDKLRMTPPANSSRETTQLAHPVKELKHIKFLTFYGSVQKADITHCHKYAVKDQFLPHWFTVLCSRALTPLVETSYLLLVLLGKACILIQLQVLHVFHS